MNTKKITVTYVGRRHGNLYSKVPKLQMEGAWLEELGFTIGSSAAVEYGDGVITIRLTRTAPQPAPAEHRRAQMRQKYEDMYRSAPDRIPQVAEPRTLYDLSRKPQSSGRRKNPGNHPGNKDSF